jgi:hypothetical protein
MPNGDELFLLVMLSGSALPPLFARNWRALGLIVLVGLGLCAALFALLWYSADPRVFLSGVNTVFAIFAAIALLAGAALKVLLFLVWPPRRTIQ